MSDIDWDNLLQMRECCADCAFRPGTQPRSTPLQPEKAKLCVETSTVFFCHEHPDTAGSSQVVCRGFVDAVAAKMRDGYYDRLPEWKRKVKLTILDAIEATEDGKMPDLLQMIRDMDCETSPVPSRPASAEGRQP